MRQRLIKLGCAGVVLAAAGALAAGPDDGHLYEPAAGAVVGHAMGRTVLVQENAPPAQTPSTHPPGVTVHDGGALLVQGQVLVFPTQTSLPTAAPQPAEPQAIPEIPKQILELIDQLHSPVYATREAATFALMRLDPADEDIVRAAAEVETDNEAFTRLVEAAVHLHLRARTPLTGQQAALGITLNIEPVHIGSRAEPTASVAVMSIEPGFPAEEVLKPGDRIVAVDGQPFPLDLDVVAFRDRINLTRPGSAVHFTIIRDGKLMKVDVVLAGLSNDTSLANLVDERRNTAQVYVENILASAQIERSSPALVMPDGTEGENRFEIRGQNIMYLPQGVAPGPILIGPQEMIVPNSP